MKRGGLAAAMALILGTVACTPDFARQSEADVIMRIVSISTSSNTGGGAGQGGSGTGDVLQSDVVSTAGTVFNDNATVTLDVIPKNQNGVLLGQFNDVSLDRYQVRFIRTDGRTQEGVDVPFRFTGPLARLIPAPGSAAVSIVLIRHEAKLEAPLRNLQGAGGIAILQTIAEITVYGRTTSGDAVEATGRVNVAFADFAG